VLIAKRVLLKAKHTIARQNNDFLRLRNLGNLHVSFNTPLDYSQTSREKQMITRNNEDGSVTFIYESWDELVKSEPKWQPDPDLQAKDRADERIWGY
jgi:hypothetical protein